MHSQQEVPILTSCAGTDAYNVKDMKQAAELK